MASKVRKLESVFMVTLLVLLGVIFLLGTPTPSMADESTMENMKNKAAGTAEGIMDTADSWVDWARDKISEGLGLKNEDERISAEVVKDKAADIAGKAKDKISSAASDAAGVSSQKASEAMEKAGEVKNNLKSKAEDAKQMMSDGADEAMNTAGRSYEGAKQKVTETYEAAKDSVTEGARESYEAAKEASSKATGDAGAKMQKTYDEL